MLDQMVSFGVLVIIASLMTAALVWVIRTYTKIDSLIQGELLFFVLVMMASMFFGAAAYIAYPGEVTLTYAVGGNMFVMVIGLAIILNSLSDESEPRSFPHSRFTPLFSTLLIFNECLMGFVFHEAQTGVISGTSTGLVVGVISGSVNTYWFFTPMMVEMISAFTLVKSRTREVNGIYSGLVAATAFPPTLLPYAQWIRVGFVLTAGALIYAIVEARKAAAANEKKGVAIIFMILGGMIASFLVANYLVFALTIVAGMFWFYNDAFVRKLGETPVRAAPQLNAAPAGDVGRAQTHHARRGKIG